MLKQQFPDLPILALTATATQRVCDDLKSMLRIEACESFSASINRPNLLYEVSCLDLLQRCSQTISYMLGVYSILIFHINLLDSAETAKRVVEAYQSCNSLGDCTSVSPASQGSVKTLARFASL